MGMMENSSNHKPDGAKIFDFDAADLFADEHAPDERQSSQISADRTLPFWQIDLEQNVQSRIRLDSDPISRIIDAASPAISDGDQVMGTVVKISRLSLTLELKNGKEILFPVSEIFDNVEFNPHDLFRLGQNVSLCGAVVASIFNSELNQRTVRSSLLQGNSWKMIREAKSNSAPLVGKVVAIAKVGVFVDLRSVLGFIPRAKCEILYPQESVAPIEPFPMIRVRVTDVEPEKRVFLRPTKPIRGSRHSQRGHLTSDDQVKRSYESLEAANEVISKMERRPCHELSAYQCMECSKWHVGNALIAHCELDLVDVLPDFGLERSRLLWGVDESESSKKNRYRDISGWETCPLYMEFIDYVLMNGANIRKVAEGETDVALEINVNESVWNVDITVNSVSKIQRIELRASGIVPSEKSATRFCDVWNTTMPLGHMSVDSLEDSLDGVRVIMKQQIMGGELLDWKSMTKSWAMCVNSLVKSLSPE
jgi:hypothetical protein